ncbi:sirohydrochlorin chelatase [Aetokthonos hydrillicola Thurmond2011]|jgi:sirohydrochlorin ferrochelatase|uniref:Sirohydrochlorin chelatase n=1 Tax=Aetokthonos hydrillicola Thurmond2011 TaxID=2712845 RepID=A0AAP5MBW3_9CYAN|nr:sirohydrochlorin chelatase [Aetokthonos hydrillicola]MBW4586922.1 sirohydrochlorin chelatase [Aetokthonos hydrillicola CCALA 1050]MDR9897603.1 sirohydrochlorin chelatase [Aetokthonos hydrillicola Thurmond2011]
MASAYLLVAHGSQDPRQEVAMKQLAEMVRKKVPSNLVSVGTGYLELCSEPLHEQIKKFGKNTITQGCNRLKVLPLFLLPGVHVMEDIPAEVVMARQALSQDIVIDLQPYLGSHPGLGSLLEKQLAATTAEARIILAHGSRRLCSHSSVEALARNLNAVAAYWSVPPSLESQVEKLVSAGYRKIAIIPYFLFAGGITDAIALKQQELKLQFPEVSFQLTEPLGVSTELANLIWDLANEPGRYESTGEQAFG